MLQHPLSMAHNDDQKTDNSIASPEMVATNLVTLSRASMFAQICTTPSTSKTWPMHPHTPPKVVDPVDINGMRLNADANMEFHISRDGHSYEWVNCTDVQGHEEAFKRFVSRMGKEDQTTPKSFEEMVQVESVGSEEWRKENWSHIITEVTFEDEKFYLVENTSGQTHLLEKDYVKKHHWDDLVMPFLKNSSPF